MKVNIKKKHIIILSTDILCILLTAGIWLWKSGRKTTVIPFGETVVLDSEKEEEDAKKWKLTNCYMHEGKMELTITDSKLYKNLEEAGIEEKYIMSLKEPEEDSFMLVTYTIHNVDATPVSPLGFHSTALFRLLPDGETEYNSVLKEHAEKDPSVLQQPKEAAYY